MEQSTSEASGLGPGSTRTAREAPSEEEGSSTMLGLDDLPEDVLLPILARLNAIELEQVRVTCKRLALLGKRPDLPGRRERLQLALLALGDPRSVALGFRQDGRPAFRRFVEQPGAGEALRQMAALELSFEEGFAQDRVESLSAVLSHLRGSTSLRDLRLRNTGVLAEVSAALEGSCVVPGLDHLELQEFGRWAHLRHRSKAREGGVQQEDPWRIYDVPGVSALRSLSVRLEMGALTGNIPPAPGVGSFPPQIPHLEAVSFHSAARVAEEGGASETGGGGRGSPTVCDPALFRSLVVRGWQGTPGRVAGLRDCVGLTSLDLSGNGMFGHEDMDTLGQFLAGMGALASLDLSGCDVFMQNLKVLARRAQLGALRSLALRGGVLTLEGPTGFPTDALPPGVGPLLGRLTALDLGGCLFHRTAAQAFEEQLRGGALRSLGLEGSPSPQGLMVGMTGLGILDAGHLTGLTSLDIGSNALDAERAGEVAARLAPLRQLSTLRLTSNRELGARGAAEFAARLSGLTSLDLSDCGIGDDAALAARPGATWRSLRSLVLDGNGISDEGAGRLAAATSLWGLTDLSLARNQLGCSGAERLALATNLGSLTRLCLKHNSIGDGGAKALAESPTLRALAHLDIQHNGVGAAGADHLAFSRSLIGLERVLWTPADDGEVSGRGPESVPKARTKSVGHHNSV